MGLDVHRGARVAAAGHGRQVLLSQATRDLVGAKGLRDLGEHRLKDLSAPERIYQLGYETFPPLKTLYRTNLPVPPTPFIGRERELEDVAAFLSRDARLLTLSGPGGTGKTRLALQSAAAASDRFPDGVYWVPLAALRDPGLVTDVAARALGASDDLVDHIADKSLLVLLDNFEHVIEAASDIARVLAACPNARLMVTSRELLRLPGEQAYPVPPLDSRDAEELFRSRARAAKPDFSADEGVADLCARLENLPLALELAAARLRILSTDELMQRLSKRLDLLKAGRGIDPRHETLRATIEWSHDLLDEDEERLFARLAVFRDGCTLEAAEQICDADLDTLQSLVDKSLVRVRDGGRFWMLETIREFAAERLSVSGELDPMNRRHARFFSAVADSSNLSVERRESGEQRFDLVLPEQANLRVALDWATQADPKLGLALACALETYWVTNSPAEGSARFATLLERANDVSAGERARALRCAGSIAYDRGDFARAKAAYDESLALYRQIGDERGIGHMLLRTAFEAKRLGDRAKARSLADASLQISRRVGALSDEAQVLTLLASIAFEEGRHEEALDLFGRSADLSRRIGLRWWEIGVLLEAAESALKLGRVDDVQDPLRRSTEIAQEIGDRQALVYALALSAWLAAARGQSERAARIWGAIEAEEDRGGRVGQWDAERLEYLQRVKEYAASEFDQHVSDGRSMSLNEAVEYAIDSRI